MVVRLFGRWFGGGPQLLGRCRNCQGAVEKKAMRLAGVAGFALGALGEQESCAVGFSGADAGADAGGDAVWVGDGELAGEYDGADVEHGCDCSALVGR